MRRATRGGLVVATAGMLALGVWSAAAVAQTPPADGTVQTTAQPEQTAAAPETTAPSEPTTTRRQREDDIPGTDETVPPETVPPETAPPETTTPETAPPVVEAVPPAAPTPPAAANPAAPTPVAAPAAVAAAPAPEPTHLPVTGPGGVAALAGLSLTLATAGLILRRARRRTDEILVSRPL
jgi:outer membrane biosynthesis protein TonB